MDAPVSAKGLDAAGTALPDCPVCHGKGSKTIARPDGSLDFRVCPCVLFAQRRRSAEAIIRKHMPGDLASMTFASFQTGGIKKNEMALDVARNFVDLFEQDVKREGTFIGFYGVPAAGKTHLATAIAHACVKRYLVRPSLLSVPDILRGERATFNAKRGEDVKSPVEHAMTCDLLILDDLGAEYNKDADSGAVSWVDEQLFLILDARVRWNRPVVYTTNLTREQLPNALSERVWSRIERRQPEGCPLEVRPVKGANRISSETRSKLFAPRS